MRRNIHSGSPFEATVGYCRAVVQSPFVFVSGTVGRDPDTGEMPADVEGQCANALRIIAAALASLMWCAPPITPPTAPILPPAGHNFARHLAPTRRLRRWLSPD